MPQIPLLHPGAGFGIITIFKRGDDSVTEKKMLMAA
jgi:hypothetical protein